MKGVALTAGPSLFFLASVTFTKVLMILITRPANGQPIRHDYWWMTVPQASSINSSQALTTYIHQYVHVDSMSKLPWTTSAHGQIQKRNSVRSDHMLTTQIKRRSRTQEEKMDKVPMEQTGSINSMQLHCLLPWLDHWHVYVRARVCVYVYVRVFACVCECTHACSCGCVCVHACVSVCVHAYQKINKKNRSLFWLDQIWNRTRPSGRINKQVS